MEKQQYIKDNIKYIYSNQYDRLLLITPKEIYILIDMWDLIIKGVKENLTYEEVKILSDDHRELYAFCDLRINDYIDEPAENLVDGYNKFVFPSEYSVDYGMFNENDIMSKCLSWEILDRFVDIEYTGYGEELLIINLDKEKEIIQFCEKQGWKIVKDNGIIEDSLSKGYWENILDVF